MEDRHTATVFPSDKKETSKLLYQKTYISKELGSGIDDGWLVDSGATCHMTNTKQLLKKFKQGSEPVLIANGSELEGVGRGEFPIVVKGRESLTVTNVLCVPDLTTNLLSISELVHGGKIVVFDRLGCKILNSDGGTIATASLRNGAYQLDLHERCCLVKQNDNTKLWHRRFGHLNFRDMCKLKNQLVNGIKFIGELDKCPECVLGKSHRKSFSSSESRSFNILELIHSDVCGPMQVSSFSGNLYLLTFINDFSRKVFI